MSLKPSFVKTPEELKRMWDDNGSLYLHRKTMNITWLIDQETYLRLLPPGLDPLPQPIVSAYIADFPYSGFELAQYQEAGLFVLGQKDGVPGALCLAMPIDCYNEMGILKGRDTYGYPKKLAKVSFRIQGDRYHAEVRRNGITFFEVDGILGEQHEHYQPTTEFDKFNLRYTYLLDHKSCPNNGKVDVPLIDGGVDRYDIKLWRQGNTCAIHKETPAKVEITMRESLDDPWIELKPTMILSACYRDDSLEMCGAEVVKEYKTQEEIDAVMPYLFARYDEDYMGYQSEFVNCK